ncbi:hypothetical protein G9A89_012143 [Geosiphon pyriformis]|nr:hypothetical protein G9A89_012143 [Geosiphon pyriformis]
MAFFLFWCLLSCVEECYILAEEWIWKATFVFSGSKITGQKIMEFVCNLCLAFRNKVWLVCAKYHAYMEKNEMILHNGSALVLVSGLFVVLSISVVKLLSIVETIGIGFGFHRSYLFFSSIKDSVSVHIGA